MKMFGGIVLLVFILGLTACSGSGPSSAPSAPSPIPQPVPQPTPAPNPNGVMPGFVLDSADRPLAGAIVEVVGGPQAGTSATSDGAGAFSLTGTFDDATQFRATKEGYVAATQPWRRSSPSVQPSLMFHLAGLASPVNIAGDYSLTFIADTECAAALPAELQTRTYPVTIAELPHSIYPANTRFVVTPSGAPFLAAYNHFGIAVDGDYLAFWLGDPQLVEQVAPNTYLQLGGEAEIHVGTSAVSTISAAFDGVFDYCTLRPSAVYSAYDCGPSQAVAHAQCYSENHQLILTRR